MTAFLRVGYLMTEIVNLDIHWSRPFNTVSLFLYIMIPGLGNATFEIPHVRRIRDETEQNLIRRPLNPVQLTTKPPTLKTACSTRQHKTPYKCKGNVHNLFPKNMPS